MIDPHVHLRDWNQSYKETVKHGIYVAWAAGLDAVFEEPNTSPEIISGPTIERRLALANQAIAELKEEYKRQHFEFWHGLLAGITPNPEQIEEVVEVYNIHRQAGRRVVGMKIFFGPSTGDLGVVEERDQRLVLEKLARLDYRGVIQGHFEEKTLFKPLWDPSEPYTHTLARPPESEVESVRKIIRFAKEAGYKGTLHVCHISVPEALEVVEEARKDVDFRITCGLTPHHAMLNAEMMYDKNGGGLPRKMNPPLRLKWMQEEMLDALIKGRIDWPESDHAPHTLDEKLGKVLDKDGNPVYASGVPVLPYWPVFIGYLKRYMSWTKIHKMTHSNIAKAFGVHITNSRRIEKTSEDPSLDLSGQYQFDVFKNVKHLIDHY